MVQSPLKNTFTYYIPCGTIMVLKLYGSSQSTCTRRVGTVLREKKIPFELIEINLAKGAHKSPEFLQKQPTLCVAASYLSLKVTRRLLALF